MKQKGDTSNIVSVLKDFKDFVELKKYAESQYLTIAQLQHQVKQLEEENNNLKRDIVKFNKDLFVPAAPNLVKIEITPEESIVTEQIFYMQHESAKRPLSLEEVKKLDLLVKNLKLIKDQPTTIIAEAPRREIPEAQLLEIAERKLEDE